MSSYFLSYSRADQDFALKFAADLTAAGLFVWVDQHHIQPSQHWDRAIETALRDCDGVIVVLSPSSAVSPNVADEVSLALDAGKRVIPFMVATCALPLRLTRIQYVDGTLDYLAGLNRIVETLEASTRPAAATERASDSVGLGLLPDVIARAERRLAPWVGPIAGLLVRRASIGAVSEAALYEALQDHLPSGVDRKAFSKTPAVTRSRGAILQSALPSNEIAHIGSVLTKHLGPIAPRLVAEEGVNARSIEALCRRLAVRITDPKSRMEFLKEVGITAP